MTAEDLEFLRHDEIHYVDVAGKFLNGDWWVDYFVNPTLYIYVLYAATVLWGGVLVGVGTYDSFSEFVFDATLDPYPLILVGRVVTFVASLLGGGGVVCARSGRKRPGAARHPLRTLLW